MQNSNPRIIVALDYDNELDALNLVEQLDPKLCRLKVGKGMFTRLGPSFVKQLVAKDFDIFLDLKFHDIPNQVALACKAAADLGVWMLTLHAQGGRKMLEAANKAVASYKNVKPKLVAVTVLTSLNQADLTEMGLTNSIADYANQLAKLSMSAGLDGAVCSPHEVKQLKQTCGKDFCLVTPGVRLASDSQDDQQRVTTPEQAIQFGADYLVIGRSITTAVDPLATLVKIAESIKM